MTKRALTILVVAVVAVGGATAAIATSLGGDDAPAAHTMPNGHTMEGGSMHTMSDGHSMSGAEMGK